MWGSWSAYNGFSEVDGLGVEIDFFDFYVGTHHEVLAPERNREHSIGGSGGDFECGVYGALTIMRGWLQKRIRSTASDFNLRL